MTGIAARRAALSAAVGAPVPCRAWTTLSSIRSTKRDGSTNSSPHGKVAVKAPLAFAAASSAMSAEAGPWRGGATRLAKIRGELTMAACSGWASGTLITSIRNSAVVESWSGVTPTQPGSSLGERTGAEPEM